MAGAGDETSPEDREPDQPSDNRPKPVRAGVIDELVAARIREQRERVGMSQSELGRRMAALGWPWHPQTVQRVEAGQRKVTIGEAEALAGILDTSVTMLMTAGQEAALTYILGSTAAKMRDAWKQIAAWSWSLSIDRKQLTTSIRDAENSRFKDSENIVWLLDEAREALTLTAEDAVAEGTERHEQWLEEVQARRNHADELFGDCC
jgi:transcriptional regulator with XRE-family HTH domain